MAFQTVFKRYELKYMLTLEQKEKILEAMSPYMQLDKYGRTTIRNIYFDTDNYRLIRRSIEKHAYKEKLRIRSYSQATADSTVFVELKKKYEKVVYKRRLPLCESEAMAWVCRERACTFDTQISREIDYFIDFYGKLNPTVFLSYEREAYYDKGGGDFRVTFDDHILCRQTDVSLCSSVYGGMGYLGFAALFTVIMCAMFLLYNALAGNVNKTIKNTIPEDLDYTGAFDDIFAEYTKKNELVKVKSTNMGSMFRLTYNVTLKDATKEKQMIDRIRERNGNLEIMVSKQENRTAEL